jgi:paraquat-inducible protein B
MSQQGRHDEWGGKNKDGGEKKKRKFFLIFIFPLLACVCVWVIFDSIQSGRLTHS